MKTRADMGLVVLQQNYIDEDFILIIRQSSVL